MVYESQKEKISKAIDTLIIPSVKRGKDLEYSKVISELAKHINCTESMVEKALEARVRSGEIREIRVLTIPDKEVRSWLNGLIEEEKKIKEELKILEHG